MEKTVSFNISFDTKAGAMYIKVADNKIDKTVEVEDEVFVDIDSKGRMVGVEFLNPSKIDIKIKQIFQIYKPSPFTYFEPDKLQKAFESLAKAAVVNN